MTLEQYQNAKRQLAKLAKHTETIKTWEAAMKGYKAPDGHRVVEIEIKDGKTRYITEEDEEQTKPLLKKSG